MAFTLALLMFFTSVGFAADVHFCQGKFKSLSFIGKAKNCHEKASTSTMKNCPNHQKMMRQNQACSKKDDNCCDNKTVLLKNDLEKIKPASQLEINFEFQKFAVAFIAAFFKPLYFEEQPSSYNPYRAPIISRDIPVLNQSFLL